MDTFSLYRSQFKTLKEFEEAVKKAKKSYRNFARVDDGDGGIGYKFFENAEDYRIWKQQK